MIVLEASTLRCLNSVLYVQDTDVSMQFKLDILFLLLLCHCFLTFLRQQLLPGPINMKAGDINMRL